MRTPTRHARLHSRLAQRSHTTVLPAPCACAQPGLTSGPALARQSLSLLRTALPALSLLSLGASAAQQAVAGAVYVALAATGVPAQHPLTLVAGGGGVAAGLALGLAADGAAYRLLHAAAQPGCSGRLRAAAGALREAVGRAPPPHALGLLHVRRLLSLAWSYALTFPLPLFALPNALELSLAVPCLVLESGEAGSSPSDDPQARSTQLMQRRTARLAHALLLLSCVRPAQAPAPSVR